MRIKLFYLTFLSLLLLVTQPAFAMVRVNELQTRGQGANDEFIELYNDGEAATDITGWQVRFKNTTSVAITPTLVATIKQVTLLSKAYFVLHTDSVVLPLGVAEQSYGATGKLSDVSKTVALFAPDVASCRMTQIDAVEWLGTTALPVTPTPGAGNAIKAQPLSKSSAVYSPLPMPGCVLSGQSSPSSEIPAQAATMLAPQLSELLPNPGPPLSDSTGEFIELYNPNPTSFDLSGFGLASGKRTYVFPSGTILPALGFRAFYSDKTKLSLTNTGGQVTLLDVHGTVLQTSQPYGPAKDDQAWVAGESWQWTTQPTPGTANSLVGEAPKPEPVSKAAIKKTSKITKKVSLKPKKSTKMSKTHSKQSSPQVLNATTAAVPTSSPLHMSVLASVGVLAVLYGAYEYRHDLANKIKQYRANRAARREIRQQAEGRRGD